MLRRILLVTICCVLGACAADNSSGTFELTVVHLNDTHSHLEPSTVSLKIDETTTDAKLGGFARLKTVVDEMRAEDAELLLLHAGDAFQGTLYFALFDGIPEIELLNMLELDAMTFGNHEFDRSTGPIPGWINRSRFAWLSANIDFSGEPAIAPLTAPHLIREVRGERIGIIGVTTEQTPQITTDVGQAVFQNAVESARQQVAVLTAQGINKIILLSHLGYAQEIALAEQVSGIDVIVGGHSHTLLGDAADLAAIGLTPEGPYPTEVTAPDGRTVLVVQAWRWGKMIGRLQVTFDTDGAVIQYTPAPVIPLGEHFSQAGVTVPLGSQTYWDIVDALDRTRTARIVAPDPVTASVLASYQTSLEAYKKSSARYGGGTTAARPQQRPRPPGGGFHAVRVAFGPGRHSELWRRAQRPAGRSDYPGGCSGGPALRQYPGAGGFARQ